MGLDLYAVRFSKARFVEDENYYDWENEAEIAYGRKTWAIEHFFSCYSDYFLDDAYAFIREEAWDKFYEIFNPYREKLTELVVKFNESNYEEDEVYSKIYMEIEHILDKCFIYDGYQLGADWEASYVLNWLDAYPKAKEAYAEGDKILMVVSY